MSALLAVEGNFVLVGLAVFSLVSSKLPTYILSLAPWMAVVMGRWLLNLRDRGEAMLFRRLAKGCLATTLVLAALSIILIPRIESRLGVNASMHELSHRLSAAGADRVYVDRYWPGLEFYLGEIVNYVQDRSPRQRSTDNGVCRGSGCPHFYPNSEWPRLLSIDAGTNIWLVHYNRNKRSPFLPKDSAQPPSNAQHLGSVTFWRVR